MSASIYARKVLIIFGIILACAIGGPLLAFGGAIAGCRNSPVDGCGDAFLPLMMFGMVPVLIVVLIWLGRTIVRRIRWLGLPVWYAVIGCLLIAGLLRATLVLPSVFVATRAPWDEFAVATLAVSFCASLYWIPARDLRIAVPVAWRAAVAVAGILLFLRFADVMLYPLYPLSFLTAPFGFILYAPTAFMPMRVIPAGVAAISFAAIWSTLVWRWRSGAVGRSSAD